MTDDKKLTIGVLGTGAGNMRALGALAGDTLAPCPIKDRVSAAPVLSGARGQAWRADLTEIRRRLSLRAEDDATLAHWVIEAPWAHPVWHSYSLVLVHLRHLPDRRETLIYLDDATHELWLYAIDPDADRNKMLVSWVGQCWLEPKNFAAQFIEISDDLARERVQRSVQMICDGALSPDTDHTSAWARLWGDNMLKDRANRRPPVKRW